MKKNSVFFQILVILPLLLGLLSQGCKPRKEAKVAEPKEDQTILAPKTTTEELKELPVEVKEIGLSLKLPQGWKQGNIVKAGDEKFSPDQDGRYFFKSSQERYPYATVSILSKLPAGLSLDRYTTGIAFNQILSKTKKNLDGLPAIEIVEEDISSFEPRKKIPIIAMHLYIQDKDKLIWLSFWSEKKEFDTYKLKFYKSLESVILTQ